MAGSVLVLAPCLLGSTCPLSDRDVLVYIAPCSTSTLPHSSGPVPLLEVINVHARVHALNRWRRPSSVTAYLPIWHADVYPFTMSFTHRSAVPSGLKHVFPALWIPDIL